MINEGYNKLRRRIVINKKYVGLPNKVIIS